jgi:hypothetical protein
MQGRILFRINPEQAPAFRMGSRRADLKSTSGRMACFIYSAYLVYLVCFIYLVYLVHAGGCGRR